MTADLLSRDQLEFIRVVMSRRLGVAPGEGAPSPPDVDGDDAFHRAVSVASAVLAGADPPRLSRPSALLAMCAQLDMDGYRLIAPQGATAGMVQGLATGRVTTESLVRWLEDRAVGRI